MNDSLDSVPPLLKLNLKVISRLTCLLISRSLTHSHCRPFFFFSRCSVTLLSTLNTCLLFAQQCATPTIYGYNILVHNVLERCQLRNFISSSQTTTTSPNTTPPSSIPFILPSTRCNLHQRWPPIPVQCYRQWSTAPVRPVRSSCSPMEHSARRRPLLT